MNSFVGMEILLAITGGVVSFRELEIGCNLCQVGLSGVRMETIRRQEKYIILRKGRKRTELQDPLRIGKLLGASACFWQGWLPMCI